MATSAPLADDVPMSAPITLSTIPRPVSIPPGPTLHGDPCTLVIFGAAGDLARRKLVPAVYYLAKKRLLPHDFRVVGVGIEQHDDDSFRTVMREALVSEGEVKDLDPDVWTWLSERIFWIGGNLTEPAVYGAMKQRLQGFEMVLAPRHQNRLFYLAVPPAIFEPIVQHLSASGVCRKVADATARPWRRVIVEKPFGHDLASAHALNQRVLDAFAEHQVYRIDHYVGKETVQNVLVLRSANAIFESVWSHKHITHVQITAAETVGVEERAKYYERAGVVRDMFQNHLLQLVALTAMEPPLTPSADSVRDEKVKVLRAIRPLVEGDQVSGVRAQYTAGMIKDAPVVGYREEPGVAAASTSPTYAALRVMVDTDRWRGVPFYIRSGKRMKRRVSEVAIQFRLPHQLMYEPSPNERVEPNVLVLRIQPDDGVSLGFGVKVPGAALALTPGIEVQAVKMDFDYADAFGTEVHPAYETLLLDCMLGDATLFTRSDEVEAAWRVTDPLLAFWEHGRGDPIGAYPAGTWGPSTAEDLIARDGHVWRTP
jgi:glucose-6-phosphate 1-dehydrogenase